MELSQISAFGRNFVEFSCQECHTKGIVFLHKITLSNLLIP